MVGCQAGGAGESNGLMTVNAYNTATHCNTAATLGDNYSYGQTIDEGLLYRNLSPAPRFNNTT